MLKFCKLFNESYGHHIYTFTEKPGTGIKTSSNETNTQFEIEPRLNVVSPFLKGGGCRKLILLT